MPLLRLFTKAGAVPTERDKKEETPLHVACTSRRDALAAVQYLCEAGGCDPEALNSDGWSPVFLCVAVGHLHVLDYLLARGA